MSSELEKKMLVVLDLNGTLIDSRTSAVSEGFYDYYVCGRYVYERPFLHFFLDTLMANPRVGAVGVWTSCAEYRAHALVDRIFEDHEKRPLFVWARNKCLPNPHGSTPYATIKDLSDVWEAYPDYDERNTLVVDDSPEKYFLDHRTQCHLPVATYDYASALHGHDTTLQTLAQTILPVSAATTDV